MRIVVCDDNSAYSNDIKQKIEAFFYDVDVECQTDLFCNSQVLYQSNEKYDMAFLDIEMEPYSGIEIAKKLKELNPHIVIFIITSFNKYLDEAMDLNVFRYIQKPLDIQRLHLGLKKALETIDDTIIKFYFKNKTGTKSISSNDIVYIETVGRTTKVVTTEGEYTSENKMDFWKEKLVASFFFRVHKSFIVNIKYITDYHRDTAILLNKYSVPIAYRTQAEFRKYFFKYIGGR